MSNQGRFSESEETYFMFIVRKPLLVERMFITVDV